MFEDVINDIQDSIARLHCEIEAKRKGINDAVDANQPPKQHGKELAKIRDEIQRLLEKCYRANKC